MEDRRAEIERTTGETEVVVDLRLDGSGAVEVSTGIGFFDHMLETLGCHGRFDLRLECDGDLRVGDHHTVEDCSLALGAGVDRALGERAGIERFGHGYAPMDEALARAVVDFSGRPCPVVDLGLERETLGGVATENLAHVFRSFATEARAALHVDVLRGDNDHHRAEAAFKAAALALRRAIAPTGRDDVPSTKGTLQ